MTTTINCALKTEVGNHFVANYPPFSSWSAAEIPAFESALDQPSRPGPLSLYVHIPFCEQRCMYCCYRTHLAASSEKVDTYLDAVIREAALLAKRPAVTDRPLVAAYLGGGSPSYLSAAQLRRLLAALAEQFDFGQVEEFTIECDPHTTTTEKLAVMRDFGVTRVSLGFQTLEDKILILMSRVSERADCLTAYDLARAAGFGRINIDLLTGLPWQTDQNWSATVEEVIGLAPDCVTVYQMDLTSYFGPLFEKLAHAGMLSTDHDQVRLTRGGLVQVDWLLPKFYLPRHVGLRYT